MLDETNEVQALFTHKADIVAWSRKHKLLHSDVC